MISQAHIQAVKAFLLNYQEDLCARLCNVAGKSFQFDQWQRPLGGGGITKVLSKSDVIEKAGVNFSHVMGECLPESASNIRSGLAGARFDAMGVSSVIHPFNPMAPTSHMNIRLFVAYPDNKAPIWWFGGGYDLTPYYLFEEDARFWHEITQSICAPFGKEVYPKYKKWADQYFYLPHRQEHRGIGGLFFDDLNSEADWGWDIDKCFAFLQSVGQGFIESYLPILTKRFALPFTPEQKDFQLHRRGRYVEFNLIYDRGTIFGLQSKGRTESILMSLPAQVNWTYQYPEPPAGSQEAALMDVLKQPREWV